MKKYLRLAVILFVSVSVFFGASYLYLYNSLKSEQKAADVKEDKIPYDNTPENCGLLFVMPEDKKLLFFLDFRQEISYIINVENNGVSGDFAGYPADYRFITDYYSLAAVIDRLGGIDMEIEGEVLRYTGIQVCDLVFKDCPSDIRFKAVSSLCERISENGFSNDDFAFLIENTKTNLKMPDCFYWQKYIKSIFSNSVFVNWEI